MSLYTAPATDFIQTCHQGHIADLLTSAFHREHGHLPDASEIRSWRASLPAIADIFEQAGFHDQWVILEYTLPLASQRIDCMITGRDQHDRPHVVLIELKQWSRVLESAGEHEVRLQIEKDKTDTRLHPCVQVDQYRQYLQDCHTAFHGSAQHLQLSACSYLHNYPVLASDPLRADKFAAVLHNAPLFNATEAMQLSAFLAQRVGQGNGAAIATRVNRRTYAPSKKLMQQVAGSINKMPQYHLLDEQLISFDAVMQATDDALKTQRKSIILVCGKPGSGKSIVAMKLLGSLLAKKKIAYHATGSKAFTESLKYQLPKSDPVFRFTHQFRKNKQGKYDVVIVDEAHRIREFSSTGQIQGTDTRTQFQELFDATKILVLFADDAQAVRPSEVGSIDYLRSEAHRLTPHVREFTLTGQFRCGGAERFIDWVDNTLGIRSTTVTTWTTHKDFDFQIAATPFDLENWVLNHVQAGATGRLTAGFCWPWSFPKSNGDLISDIKIGAFERPWNASPKAKVLAQGIPNANLWATVAGGVQQIGCVYSAQGFEFDYVGVIFGKDLRFDVATSKWISDPKKSCDEQINQDHRFEDFVRNAYRILLTRGIKGCHVYFEDKTTEAYFRRLMAT